MFRNFLQLFTGKQVFEVDAPAIEAEAEAEEAPSYDLYYHIETGLWGNLRHVPAEMLNGEPDGAWRIDFLPNPSNECGRWVTPDDVIHANDLFNSLESLEVA